MSNEPGQSIEQPSNDAQTNHTLVDELNNAAQEHLDTDPEKSFALSLEAYDHAQTIDYQQGIADSLLNLALYHIHKLNFGRAFKHATDADNLFEKMGNAQKRFRTLEALWTLFHRTGDLKKGLEVGMQRL